MPAFALAVRGCPDLESRSRQEEEEEEVGCLGVLFLWLQSSLQFDVLFQYSLGFFFTLYFAPRARLTVWNSK